MKSICVFCGANAGNQAVFETTAIALGKLLAKNNQKLVFGAGNIGLMGIIADAVLAEDGYAIGVIPSFLKEKEVCHMGLSELYVTETMHERKAKLASISDGFIAMPGGFGTLEELSEILTWAQLGLHGKPIGLLNIAGYYDPLIAFMDHMVENGFVKPHNRETVLVDERPEGLLAKMSAYQAPDQKKWLDQSRI